MNKRTLQANVLRGVRLLDEKDPHWWNGGEGVAAPAIAGMVGHIDLSKLDMRLVSYCVLGQRERSGNYHEGLYLLGIHDRTDGPVYGFNTEKNFETSRDPEGLSYITELWASVIQSRRFPRRKIAKDPFCIKANRTWVRA